MNADSSPVDILLVEDNPSDAELAIRALKKSHLANRIEWVMDGEDAIDFINHCGDYSTLPKGNPKVVLLDLRLPKVDGIEVLKSIRSSKNKDVKEIPVVVLTSSKEDNDLISAYDLGVNSYVRKPISFDEFSKTVGELGMYWLLVNQIPESIHHES
ncbi:MAG: response regulator [Sedimenticola sp.]